jgi:hypothetical protein
MVDDVILDDVAGMLAGDPGQMLAATATAGAQVRRGLTEANRDVISTIAGDGKPRAIVVTGYGRLRHLRADSRGFGQHFKFDSGRIVTWLRSTFMGWCRRLSYLTVMFWHN